MMAKYDRPANGPEPAAADPNLKQDWPYGHRTPRMPDLRHPPGDGSLGVMEGFDAKIFADGTQPVRWWNRNDCNGETAGAMAAAGVALQNPTYLKTAGNIGDWLYFRSRMSLGDRADPKHPAYGLIGWNDTPQYCGPGSMDGYAVYYGDDNARSMLGMMLAAAMLKTDRYDERLLKCLLANLRISGQRGFQPDRLDQGPLEKAGWRHFFHDRNASYSPHYQATMWACYLWAYRQTGFDLFLQRAKTAIGMTMAAYPDRWVWMNGIQQERAKMLLALAWLVRVEDTPEHRAWLRRMAGTCWPARIRAEPSARRSARPERQGCPPPASNEAYGTAEAPLIQSNADAASDLLYTCNFAFARAARSGRGHRRFASTARPRTSWPNSCAASRSAVKRIPNWTAAGSAPSTSSAGNTGPPARMRAGAPGALRADGRKAGSPPCWRCAKCRSSLWDITADSRVSRHFAALRPRMIPDDALAGRFAEKVRHAAVGKTVTLRTKFSESYPGDGAASLTDGLLAKADHLDPAWLGFQGDDLVATIDLGEPVQLHELSGSFLQDVPLGVFLPRQVEFLAGNDPAALQFVGTATPVATETTARPAEGSFSRSRISTSAPAMSKSAQPTSRSSLPATKPPGKRLGSSWMNYW